MVIKTNVKFFVTFLIRFLKNSASDDDTWWLNAANIPPELFISNESFYRKTRIYIFDFFM